MRRLIGALFVVSAATVANASPEETSRTEVAPASTLSAEPVSPQRRRLATRLVDLLHPDQVSIDVNMRGWEDGMRKMLAADVAFSKLELAYPGISSAAIQGARPVALEFSQDFVKNVKSLKADVFAQRLTVTELQQALAFFEKPVGQKFAKRMAEQASPGGLLDKVKARAEGGGSDLTMTDLAGETRKTTLKVMTDMSPAEVLDIMRFEQLPSAKTFAAAGQEGEARILEMLKSIDPKWLQSQQEAVERAALRFADQHPQK